MPMPASQEWKRIPPDWRVAYADLPAGEQEALQGHLLEESRELVRDLRAAVARYLALPDSLDGLLVNGDVLNTLLPSVAANPSQGFSALESIELEVPMNLFQVFRAIHDQALDRAQAAGLPVLITSGGQGSGKTTLANELLRRGLVGAALDAPHTDPGDLIRSVQGVRARRMDVVVVFVDRDFESAVRAMLYRTYEEGRHVHLGRMAKAHYQAPDAVIRAASGQRNEPRVWLAHVRNRHRAGTWEVSGGPLHREGKDAVAAVRSRPYCSEWDLDQIAWTTFVEEMEHGLHGTFEPIPADAARELERRIPEAGRCRLEAAGAGLLPPDRRSAQRGD